MSSWQSAHRGPVLAVIVAIRDNLVIYIHGISIRRRSRSADQTILVRQRLPQRGGREGLSPVCGPAARSQKPKTRRRRVRSRCFGIHSSRRLIRSAIYALRVASQTSGAVCRPVQVARGGIPLDPGPRWVRGKKAGGCTTMEPPRVRNVCDVVPRAAPVIWW